MGFNSYVFQRGKPSQNNLILLLIDGIQVNELNSGGFYSGGQYNLENVDRIEVVYGPASVIYGTNAISGIINLITKNSQGLSTSVLSGNFNTFNSNFNYGFIRNNLGVRLSGMYKTTEKGNLTGSDGDNNWTPQMENFEDDYSLSAKIRYKNLVLGANFLNKQSSTTTSYPSVGTIYQEQGSFWNIMFTNIYLKHKYNLNDNINLSTKAYYRNATVSDNTISRVVDTARIGYFRPNQLFGIESVLNYSITNKLRIIFGALAETEQIAEGFSVTFSNSPEQAPSKPTKPNMLHNNLLSLFLESDLEILK
jgi:outer membrane receptor protein involved in Fe transport